MKFLFNVFYIQYKNFQNFLQSLIWQNLRKNSNNTFISIKNFINALKPIKSLAH